MYATATLLRRISRSRRNSDTKNHGSSPAKNQKARTAISASVTSYDQVPKTAWALSEAAILQNAQNTNGRVRQEPTDTEKRRSSLRLTDIKDTPPLTPLIVSGDRRLQKNFTASGGTLQGDNSDVCLNVPEGAVDKGSEVMVRGAISTDTKGAHQLLKLSLDEVIVTPIVEYSAESDYQFRKYVRIELPHFIPAGFDERDVRVYQYCSNEAGELVVKQLEKQKPDILPDNDEDNNTMTLKSTTTKPMKNKNATPVNENNAKRFKTETATSVKNKTAKTVKSKSAKTLKTDTKAMEAESMADSPVTTVAENVPTAKGRREITGKNRVFCVSAKGRRADIGRCSDSPSGTRPSSRRRPEWPRARPCAGPLRPTSAAQGPLLIEKEGSRPDYLSLPTGSVFSFDAKNKRVVVLTDHFSGYFCTYCRSEEFSNPRFGVEVYAREVERRDGGRKVDVLMKAWDGRRSIGDFREERPLEEMSGCRGMTLVDSKFLDALPQNIDVGPLSLCARLELQRPEDQRVWRHSLGLDGQPIFPEQKTKDVKKFVPCGCLRAPWRVDWQLMSDPPLTPPSHGFECLVHLEYQGFDNTQALPPNDHTKLTIQVHNVPTMQEDAASGGFATGTARLNAPDLRPVPESSDRAEDRHLRPPIPDSGGQH